MPNGSMAHIATRCPVGLGTASDWRNLSATNCFSQERQQADLTSPPLTERGRAASGQLENSCNTILKRLFSDEQAEVRILSWQNLF